MGSTAELTFNIVYTPGTFPYLRLFLLSLLKWSDCSFRLVTNGCSRRERKMVESACRESIRLECFHFPKLRTAAKGKVLSALQKMERDRFFCCLDSDIFAVGPFLDEIEGDLVRFAAIFSAPHFLMPENRKTMPPGYPGAYGIHMNDPGGRCIGTTCFAVYDNQVLSQSIRRLGIDFSSSSWAQVPAEFKPLFTQRGLKVENYDSGKILNACMSYSGKSLIYRNLPALKHIGGFSFARAGRRKRAPRSKPRDLRADYFYEMMRSLFAGEALPPIPAPDQQFQAEYQGIIDEIKSLFESNRDLLRQFT